MRVTTDLWVSALLRRVFSAGGFAAVLKRGAAEAGAVFVVHRRRFGDATLYGPAPQALYAEGPVEERRFVAVLNEADETAIAARLEKEARFDADLWVVEIEAEDASPWIGIVTTP